MTSGPDPDASTAFARSLGSAVGFVRKLVAPRQTTRRRKKRRPVDAVADAVRTTLDVGRRRGGGSSSLERQRAELRAEVCLLYTSPSPRDATLSRMPSSA